MTTPSALNEYHQAEEPARARLARLGWTYVPREALAAERKRGALGTAEGAAAGRPVDVSTGG